MRKPLQRSVTHDTPLPISEPPHPDAVLTPKQTADWLQLPRRQLQRCGVPHVVVSHKIRRYRVRDVLGWLDRQSKAA